MTALDGLGIFQLILADSFSGAKGREQRSHPAMEIVLKPTFHADMWI
jgi:hypothetical protein